MCKRKKLGFKFLYWLTKVEHGVYVTCEVHFVLNPIILEFILIIS